MDDHELPDREITPEMQRARKIRLGLGVGVPTLVAALVAGLLGVPWWLLLAFCVVIAVGVLIGG